MGCVLTHSSPRCKHLRVFQMLMKFLQLEPTYDLIPLPWPVALPHQSVLLSHGPQECASP